MTLDTSLTPQELDAFLDEQRTIRLATVGPAGEPHVVPLWFVWLDGSVYMNTTLGNVTVENLERDPRATGSVDDGDDYDTLRGVVLAGTAARADDDPRVDQVIGRWSNKYTGGEAPPFTRWRNRVFLRLDPQRVASWDFRKIPAARAARARASGGGSGG